MGSFNENAYNTSKLEMVDNQGPLTKIPFIIIQYLLCRVISSLLAV